ncbi:AmP-dependent synthetase and ligase [Seminavis robusta]|uniref:AmP-dependent synthetase and ligase n=1 Tax=Seminavis robusta TaxID=568900 RepID=A0A9N8F104_9STRA|nr:AmP-dependent synthetase and ligase [Seminavis robusta]|eukprot:Sro2216_g319410.1 AmP-dependent synthetase and ligase (262) ;mRNA; f:316-1101
MNIATKTSRAVRILGGRRLGTKLSSTVRTPHYLLLAPFSSAPMDRLVGGVMDKEFPGYFDSLRLPTGTVLDVRDHRKDLDNALAEEAGRLTCDKVRKLIEQNHAVDECVVIDINVEQHGEIPVAFVVKKFGSEGCDEELHKQLIDSLRYTIGHAGRHEELEKDLIAKLNAIWEEDGEIKDDLIRDELVNMVRDEFGPYAILKVVIVDALPKTICGRILRGTLYKIARGQEYSITPMIEDRQVLKRLEVEIQALLGAQYQDE